MSDEIQLEEENNAIEKVQQTELSSNNGDDHHQIKNGVSSSSRNGVSWRQKISSFVNRTRNQELTTDQPVSHKTNTNGSYYVAALPKIDWQMDNPTTIGEMCDDVVNYTFMYMTPGQLITMGSLNKRFRDLSSSDEIWSPIYDNLNGVKKVTSDFKKAFLTKANEKYINIQRKQQLAQQVLKSRCLQTSYALLASQAFLTSFLIFLILVPLVMDNFIDMSMVGYCSLPYFFALGMFFFITCCLLIDPYYFHPKTRKLMEDLQDDKSRKDYALNPDDEDLINLYVGHLWIWLLFILMFITKYIWFAALPLATFTVLFIPCYVFSVVYCFLPLVVGWYRRRKNIVETKIQFGCAYLLNSGIVSISSVQILLIGLKLDNIITTHWNVVLIPAWVFLIYVNCMICSHALCSLHETQFSFCYNSFGLLAHIVFGLFYQVWFIIFALRLDNVFISLYTPLFVPLWIFVMSVLTIHFFCGGGMVSFFYFEEMARRENSALL